MRPTYLALNSFLLIAALAPWAQGRTIAPHRPTQATEVKQAIRTYGSLANARLVYLHDHPQRLTTASCHPSRALTLTKSLASNAAWSANRPEVRRQLAVEVGRLPPVERKELARFWRVEANYQGLQAQRAKRTPAADGADRPRDPFLDKLAREQEERAMNDGGGGRQRAER